ncbi:MAG: hypothetical protein ABFS56_32890, partial [Pseudomonadota bacterium]
HQLVENGRCSVALGGLQENVFVRHEMALVLRLGAAFVNTYIWYKLSFAPDGVCNPVRNVLSAGILESKIYLGGGFECPSKINLGLLKHTPQVESVV